MQKQTVAILFGGRSPEHDVSLRSVTSILSEIDRDRFDVIAVAINKQGEWFLYESDESLIIDGRCFLTPDLPRCFLAPDRGIHGLVVIDRDGRAHTRRVDVVFPVLHGAGGEDGTIQGLCALAGIPCVGCGVLASAVCMDKPATKILLTAAGIENTPWMSATRYEYEQDPAALAARAAALRYPVFVKPADTGSSVGASRAADETALHKAVQEALRFSDSVLIEAYIDAREIECSVYGNDEPTASSLGEIEPSSEFYDYEAKYISNTSKLVIPAELPEETAADIRDKAVRAYKALGCKGMARVDFFVERKTGRVLLNEVNTIPGFTSISMYAKLMGHDGMDYRALVTGLLELALAAHGA